MILAVVLALLAALAVLVVAGRSELGAWARDLAGMVRRPAPGERRVGVLAGARADLALAADAPSSLDDLFALDASQPSHGPVFVEPDVLLRFEDPRDAAPGRR